MADPEMITPLADSQTTHATEHDGHWITGTADRTRIKCLRARLAVTLAAGGSPVGDWISDRIDGDWPARCCVDALSDAANG